VPAWDLVLRPVKDVAILFALGDQHTSRATGDAHRAGVEAAVCYLDGQVGPATVKGQRAWRQAVDRVVQYRERYGISDPDGRSDQNPGHEAWSSAATTAPLTMQSATPRAAARRPRARGRLSVLRLGSIFATILKAGLAMCRVFSRINRDHGYCVDA
jgi:hypothetical protein